MREGLWEEIIFKKVSKITNSRISLFPDFSVCFLTFTSESCLYRTDICLCPSMCSIYVLVCFQTNMGLVLIQWYLNAWHWLVMWCNFHMSYIFPWGHLSDWGISNMLALFEVFACFEITNDFYISCLLFTPFRSEIVAFQLVLLKRPRYHLY